MSLLVFLSLTVIHIFYIRSVNGTPCPLSESLDITNGILENKTDTIVFDGIDYLKDEWYEITEENQTLVFGCPCIRRACLWKCCGDGKAFFGRHCNDTSAPELNPFNPPVYNGNSLLGIQASDHFLFMHNTLCDERYLVDPSRETEEIYIQQNGSLYEISLGQTQWHTPGVFCVDMQLDGTPSPRMVAAVCYPDYDDSDDQDDSQVLHTAYAVGLLLSVPFLLITFMVYALIPELRNMHGLCLMAYCAGLIVAYPFLAYLKLASSELRVSMNGCLVIAFIIYFSFQTSFFWLNVMCFDIWRTFSGYRGSTHRKREWKRFALYGGYAWGVPAILTSVTAAMQFSYNMPIEIRPRFGEQKCWFSEWRSELMYFYSPVLVLVISNSVLFGVTAYRIRSIRQETAILKGSESARSDRLSRDKQRYGLYLKLFMVMGINWSVELLGFILGGSNWYWAVIDLSNIGLGFFIFIIFVWKNKVRNLLMRRWHNLRGDRVTGDFVAGRWTTRSSTAPTEDTRITSEGPAMPLKDMHYNAHGAPN